VLVHLVVYGCYPVGVINLEGGWWNVVVMNAPLSSYSPPSAYSVARLRGRNPDA
jgi:hypothetical protein